MAKEKVNIRKQRSREVFKFNGLSSLNPRLKSLSPQPIGEEIQRLQVQEGGNYKANALLDAAHVHDANGNVIKEQVTITFPRWTKNSPLFPIFETDVAKAAEGFNVDEARHLLRSAVLRRLAEH